MRLDTDEGLRLIENKILEIFCDAKTAATLLQAPRSDLVHAERLAKSGELSLADIGLDIERLRPVAEQRRRSHAGPEVEAIRIAFTTLATAREDIVLCLAAAAPAPSSPTR